MSGTVRFMRCPKCLVRWTFEPPYWLGEPWSLADANRVMRHHYERVHPELEPAVLMSTGPAS